MMRLSSKQWDAETAVAGAGHGKNEAMTFGCDCDCPRFRFIGFMAFSLIRLP